MLTPITSAANELTNTLKPLLTKFSGSTSDQANSSTKDANSATKNNALSSPTNKRFLPFAMVAASLVALVCRCLHSFNMMNTNHHNTNHLSKISPLVNDPDFQPIPKLSTSESQNTDQSDRFPSFDPEIFDSPADNLQPNEAETNTPNAEPAVNKDLSSEIIELDINIESSSDSAAESSENKGEIQIGSEYENENENKSISESIDHLSVTSDATSTGEPAVTELEITLEPLPRSEFASSKFDPHQMKAEFEAMSVDSKASVILQYFIKVLSVDSALLDTQPHKQIIKGLCGYTKSSHSKADVQAAVINAFESKSEFLQQPENRGAVHLMLQHLL